MGSCRRIHKRMMHRWLIGWLALAGLGQAAPFWELQPDGAIRHAMQADTPPVVLCMQGRQVVMESHVEAKGGLSYTARFFNVQDPSSKAKVLFRGGADTLPILTVDGRARPFFDQPQSVTFDGRLTIHYGSLRGLSVERCVYPSLDKALVLEEWRFRNGMDHAVTVEVSSQRKLGTIADRVSTEWTCPAVAATSVPAGGAITFFTSVQARRADAEPIAVAIDAERQARMELGEASRKGPGRLEVPEPALVAAWNLQKLHVLETPIETGKGRITHNGSLTYTPGVWANDPVEYSSPLFPFFGDAVLNEAAMQMYRLWLIHCREHGIDPFPGSFEHEDLRLVQRERGDDAMVLYGLSKFLLFQGKREAAEELWPLIEFSVASIDRHRRPDGIIASKTDEMEGRYPTGNANLSTSALAYGGFRHAAHLARALGKVEIGKQYDAHADALAPAIEKFFGAKVEGFDTYRYYDGNTTLRGWILLPLAMGITQRQEATLDAMVSDKLWPSRNQGGDILAESTRETEWGRETYYALRVLFKAGRADLAAELTSKVVQAQVFGPRGPYPDEDAIDMLCPGSLYPRVFTEGAFGIEPTGLDAFDLTPVLPKAWPKMALRDLRICGASWDIEIERDGELQKVTVTRNGVVVLKESGAAGKRYRVR